MVHIYLRTNKTLTLILLTWKIWRAPNYASKWQMGFSLVFKGSIRNSLYGFDKWRGKGLTIKCVLQFQ